MFDIITISIIVTITTGIMIMISPRIASPTGPVISPGIMIIIIMVSYFSIKS